MIKLTELKEMEDRIDLAEIIQADIEGLNFELIKTKDTLFLNDKEDVIGYIQGLEDILYYMVDLMYQTMSTEYDENWFKTEEVLRKYYPNEFLKYQKEVDYIKNNY